MIIALLREVFNFTNVYRCESSCLDFTTEDILGSCFKSHHRAGCPSFLGGLAKIVIVKTWELKPLILLESLCLHKCSHVEMVRGVVFLIDNLA